MGSPDSRILYAKVDSSVVGENITWREKTSDLGWVHFCQYNKCVHFDIRIIDFYSQDDKNLI
jgi:hypothetical protein